MTQIYDFKLDEMDGSKLDLADYKGKILLIVNTASKCGLAGQLNGLQALYEKYYAKGLVVIGLPSNQFKNELATDSQTANYCQIHYGVTFPMTQRVAVNGPDTTPLFVYLKKMSGHGMIKWNYTKFLIDQSGKLVHRYAPITEPEHIEPEIEKLLK
ncbi:glutathione peroxidase [Weissella viridescens]|uniref:Glutathione peroxidase n=1 Tax=Weissella viridescens TaxID=1629 RepID=A0A0R2H7G3_WEIVI|nr:glutathione peroxidase [Weissella viridescens]KRN45834.1 glutathione peroxidase [Weissella viridescens]GEA95230.1 glutathione peroxidase [Weissella viridescens]